MDANQLIDETDETNNLFSMPIRIGASGANSFELNNQFKVYPTLVKNQVTFEYDGQHYGNSLLQVFDQLGRLLYRKELELRESWTEYLDVSSWQKGYYYVKLSVNEIFYTKPFIKH